MTPSKKYAKSTTENFKIRFHPEEYKEVLDKFRKIKLTRRQWLLKKLGISSK